MTATLVKPPFSVKEWQLRTAQQHGLLTVADIAPSFQPFAGLPLCPIGEDGDVIILGHASEADARASWAAWVAYADTGAEDAPPPQWRWAQFSQHNPSCEYTELPPSRCDMGCSEYEWWVDWSQDITSQTLGAIPVTVIPE